MDGRFLRSFQPGLLSLEVVQSIIVLVVAFKIIFRLNSL